MALWTELIIFNAHEAEGPMFCVSHSYRSQQFKNNTR